jgi:hypothetical protein
LSILAGLAVVATPNFAESYSGPVDPATAVCYGGIALFAVVLTYCQVTYWGGREDKEDVVTICDAVDISMDVISLLD